MSRLTSSIWLSFGHQFARRHGHGDRNYDDEQRAPIFLHFLDAVWQIMRQFPCSFEFNEKLLVLLFDESYSCRFGTFLYNNEKDRMMHGVSRNTVSIWEYVLRNAGDFKNIYYVHRPNVIRINTSMRSMAVWPLHYRWAKSMQRQESTHEAVVAMRAKCAALESRVRELEGRLGNSKGK